MRRLLWVGVVAAAIGLGIAIWLLKPVNGPSRDLSLTADATHGAYLIRLGGCVSCHTDAKHGGAMLAGGAPLKTPFGTFYPPNITPDKVTGIGAWTLAEFSDALSNGHAAPRGNLYPVFPYEDFTLMSDQEIVDLHAGIMAVPPVAHRVPANRVPFPLNIRLLISGWKNLYFTPHRYSPDPAHSTEWNRGAYLANGPGHCVACHSPRNVLGAVITARKLTGNAAGGPSGKAPPITTAALIGDGFRTDSLAQMLRTKNTPNAGKVGDEMGQVVDDETSHWTDADLEALSNYLLGVQK